MSSNMGWQQAEDFLKQYAAYDWLVGPAGRKRAVWSAKEVADGLRESQAIPNASPALVRGWCEAARFPGARDYGANIGWRIPREDLVVFFASQAQ